MSLGKMRLFSRKEKKVVLCLALSGLMMMTTGFTQNNIQHVRIVVDGRTIETATANTSPERILNRAGVTLSDKDEYQLKKTDNQTEITVYRAVPVSVEYQGKKKEVLTSKPTVGDALRELGYNLDDVEASPGMDTKIQENLDITLKDSEARTAQLAAAARQREEQVQASRGAARYKGALTMEASAYLPSDGGGSGITASGMLAQRGVVAVDPSVIPLGTRLYIPGYGEAVAADTGGAIVGNKIDLCMEDYGEAIQFGRRSITVYVLD